MTEHRQGPARAACSPVSRSAWILLGAAALLYLGLRGAILWTNFDSVALWAYELFMCGTVGRALLGGGGDIPLPYYYDNAAGPVLMGFAVAPYYAALGPSYLALKLVSLTLGLGTLVLAWLVLRRLFGERTAHIGAFVLALAPATSAKYSLIAAGNHSENLFFSMLAMWAFVELHSRRAASSRQWLAATGLFAGWSLTIFVGAVIPLGLLALVHFGLRGWRKALRDLPWASAGFAIGLAPLVWLNLGAEGRGMRFLAAKFGGGGGGGGFDADRFVDRIGEFLGVHLVRSSTFPDFLGLPGRVADVLFLAATVAALVLCVPIAWRALIGSWKRQRSPSAPATSADVADGIVLALAAYLPLAAVAFGLSNLKVAEVPSPVIADGYRYFLPHFQNAMLLIAIAAGSLLAARRPLARIGAAAIAGGALAAGLFDLALVRTDAAATGVGRHYEGHNFAQNARLLLNKTLGLDEARRVELAETRFEPIFRSRLDYGVGYYRAMEQALRPKGTFELAELVAPLAGEATLEAERSGDPRVVAELAVRRADAARGVGTLFRARQRGPGGLLPEDVERMARWIEGGEPFAANAAEGACLEWGLTTWTRTEELLDADLTIVAAAPPIARPAFARGFGIACGRLLRRGIEGDAERVGARAAQIDAELAASFHEGVGIGLADGAEHPRVVRGVAEALPEDASEAVLAAFEARVREIWRDEAPERSSLLDPGLPDGWRERWTSLASH